MSRAPARKKRSSRRRTISTTVPARRRSRAGIVVGVGLATTDMLCVAPRLNERLVEMSVFSIQGGGSVATGLAAAATLGARARFFGRLGGDDFGRFVLGGLNDLGVDTTLVSIEPGTMSPISLVHLDEVTRRRNVLFTRGSTSALLPRDLPPRLLDSATVLMIDGYHPAVQAKAAEKARAKGITVLLNAGHLTGGMGELLALSDIVIGSERFASEFAPSHDVEKSLREMTRIGPRIAVITLGEAGAMALEDRKLVQQEAINVLVADTTGAGDVFCGAFAYATLQGWPLEQSLPFANAAAGLTCRSLGAQSVLPALAEVLAAMAGR
jgi:sulfofructose kinase